MQIKLLVEGGEMKPGPALSQKLGPLGINLGKVIAEVSKATTDFKGIKVPVTLDIDTKTKNFTVSVSTPPATELLKKELGLKKGSQQPDKIKVANAAIEVIIKVAKVKQKDMFTDTLKSAVKSILGSCVSNGILVESKDPKEVIEQVDSGVYDKIISEGKEIADKEKLDKLASDFEEVKKDQEALIKEIEQKEEEKAAAAPAAPGAPAPTEAKPEEKKEEKKK
ncbi:MAG: 50S ribosomal protein L11 [Candidatus Pacearchaeota archaeon]|nr:MAG: 50S ribosomal protein L11 [Candidatus Pacearchaeota archaeon]